MNVYKEQYNKNLAHLTSLKNLTQEEIINIVGIAQEIKFRSSVHETNNSLKGKYILLMSKYDLPKSTIAFQMAVKELGGTPIITTLSTDKIDPYLRDINYLQALSSLEVSALMVSVSRFTDLESFAEISIPMINISPYDSPCEALAAIMTIFEEAKKINKLKITYINDLSTLQDSIIIGLSKLGAELTLVPTSGEINNKTIDYCKQFTNITIENDLKKACKGAEVIYFGRNIKNAQDLFIKNLYIDDKTLIMSSLPTDNTLIDSKVYNNKNSLLLKQAQNLVNVEKAILECVIK